MTMREWIKAELFQSATMWVFTLVFITVTVAFFIDKLTGGEYILALEITTGIALAKRVVTQKMIQDGKGK